MIEFWRGGGTENNGTAERARKLEADGWDGQMFNDSQSLGADPYVTMGAWAIATERIKLSTGVTNPFTRHPAVTAAAAVTVQRISKGRASLGIGRGDSALAYLGYAPVRLEAFHQVLKDIQALLRGEEVSFVNRERSDAPSLETMSLGDRPTTTSLQWLPKDLPKVLLDVAATGPKVIEMAAPIAEQVTFSVGAIAERITWAMDLATASRRRHNLRRDGISYGAQVICICNRDINAARDIALRFLGPLARFQVIQGTAAGPKSDSDERNFAAIRRGYDMTKHTDMKSPATAKIIGDSLTPEFIDRFAIVGPPDRCIERLLPLTKLGLNRFVIVGPSFYPDEEKDGRSLFVSEVLPAVRKALQ